LGESFGRVFEKSEKIFENYFFEAGLPSAVGRSLACLSGMKIEY
jgi:hypothetical protein